MKGWCRQTASAEIRDQKHLLKSQMSLVSDDGNLVAAGDL
jgi:hypothetical protein